ncbi:MAG TPA: MerR family transcriptional regulator [Dissulfurispiraceae bacterium]|nr:MerR family transcriptional regulator [Dissulfurispiraceae bacterium]
MQKPRAAESLRLFPEKIFYKIGEVSEMVGVAAYVLRYWESEFPFLRPRKSRSGQRIYTKEDIDLLLLIQRLLHEERYTIDGVRRKLGGQMQGGPGEQAHAVISDGDVQAPAVAAEQVIQTVRMRLAAILEKLS